MTVTASASASVTGVVWGAERAGVDGRPGEATPSPTASGRAWGRWSSAAPVRCAALLWGSACCRRRVLYPLTKEGRPLATPRLLFPAWRAQALSVSGPRKHSSCVAPRNPSEIGPIKSNFISCLGFVKKLRRANTGQISAPTLPALRGNVGNIENRCAKQIALWLDGATASPNFGRKSSLADMEIRIVLPGANAISDSKYVPRFSLCGQRFYISSP